MEGNGLGWHLYLPPSAHKYHSQHEKHEQHSVPGLDSHLPGQAPADPDCKAYLVTLLLDKEPCFDFPALFPTETLHFLFLIY